MELGKIIQKYRKKNNLTQEELAERINISKSFMSKIEIGNKYPSLEIKIKLLNVLRIPVDELADSIDIDELEDIKAVLLNKKSEMNKENFDLKDVVLLANLLDRITQIQSTGSYTNTDMEIILSELSLLLKRKFIPIDILKNYILSKNYDISKLNEDQLKDIDKKFSDILELEFYKLNK